MDWPNLYEMLIHYASLPLNFIHMLIYFRPRKDGWPVNQILGLALMLSPLLLTPYLNRLAAAGAEMQWPFIIVLYAFYYASLFRFFLLEGKFSRILFGLFFVGAFNHSVIIFIYAVLFAIVGLPADEYSYDLARAIFAFLCLGLYFLIYRYVRKPFIHILDAMEEEKWYVHNFTPMMLYILSYLGLMVSFLYYSPLIMFTCVILSMALGGFYVLVYNVIISRDINALLSHKLELSRQSLMMYNHYDTELGKREEALRLMRHDLRHLLGRIDALAVAGDTASIRHCILDMVDTSAEFDLGAYSDDRSVNAVVSYHFSTAIKNGVKCSAALELPAQMTLNETELAVLFGNALENSVKATAPLGEWGRINIKARQVKDRLVIRFENNYREGDYSHGDGLGLRSIRLLCVKCGGMVETRRANGQFQLTVILPQS